MKFPSLLKRDPASDVTERAAQDKAEKLLVDSFRLVAQLASKIADYVETQRLARAGFEEQGKYLERLEKKAPRPSGE